MSCCLVLKADSICIFKFFLVQIEEDIRRDIGKGHKIDGMGVLVQLRLPGMPFLSQLSELAIFWVCITHEQTCL